MPAHILRRILRAEVQSLLPDNALATATAATESEQAGLIWWATSTERGELA
jgi:hypothetical protein